jgi:hypothetical protein
MNQERKTAMMKQKIREYAKSLDVDDVGFAAIVDYNSPRSPKIEAIFPEAKSLVVMAVKEMSHVESPNPQIAMTGRLDIMEYARGVNYKVARFLEKQCGARAMSVPLSYPLNMDPTRQSRQGSEPSAGTISWFIPAWDRG